MLTRYEVSSSDDPSPGESDDESNSENSSSESDSDDSGSSLSSSAGKVVQRMRNLSLNNVLCMDAGEEGDHSKAAANGKDKTRIQQALKKPCCKQRCKRHLSFKMVLAFCMAFWSLSKGGQDSLLLEAAEHSFYNQQIPLKEHGVTQPCYSNIILAAKALEPPKHSSPRSR